MTTFATSTAHPNPRVPIARAAQVLVVLVVGFSVGGCVLAPRGTAKEQARLEAEGAPFKSPLERRSLPDLPDEPDWRDVLRRSFLANGDLEASYFEWAAAVARIQQAGGYPNTPLAVNFSYMFSGERMKSFDRTTVNVGPDPMENLAFPTKVYQAAKVALADARAAGQRFSAAKFDLQRKVLNAWYDYALLAERARIRQANVDLLRLISQTAVGRVQAGAAQQDLLRAEVEQRRAEDELRGMEAELPQMRAMLNAMMARPPEAPLAPPKRIPVARALPADDARLFALAAERNPELAALAHRVRGRSDALELARMQYIPDINPFAGFTGTASQLVGLGLSIPTFLPEVEGMVKEARADLRATQAMYRQAKLDRAAQVVAAVYAMRNSERQAELFEQRIGPAAERIVDNTRQSYATGTGSFLDLVDAQRTLLEVRLTAVEARAAREKSLADLEALLGLDVETLTSAATRPATARAPLTAPTTGSSGETGK
jgi:outer membrane protein TolC